MSAVARAACSLGEERGEGMWGGMGEERGEKGGGEGGEGGEEQSPALSRPIRITGMQGAASVRHTRHSAASVRHKCHSAATPLVCLGLELVWCDCGVTVV